MSRPNLYTLEIATVSRLQPGHPERKKGIYFASSGDISAYADTLVLALRKLANAVEADLQRQTDPGPDR